MMGESDIERDALAYEKTGVERFLEFALERIHSDMRTLSRDNLKMSELELNSSQEALEDDVDYVQKIVYSLSLKRGEMTPGEVLGKIERAPDLETEFDFTDWWNYITAHIQIIYESLDAMGMLLTGQQYKDVWGEAIYSQARMKTLTSVMKEITAKMEAEQGEED